MFNGLPTPPHEEHFKSHHPHHGHGHSHSTSSSKRHHSASSVSSNKSSRSSTHRTTKRAITAGMPPSPTDSHMHASADGRHKRVWKACERCRMKKTKCDGEFPCKRCKDDGLVCTAGLRKKTEYKQLPRGYAEVLENTQFALIATVHKLYAMVRNQQAWELGEPEVNDRGQPVIHNIASKLGCIRPNSDIDLPVHAIFPEDEAGLNELARQLEDQQKHNQSVKMETDSLHTDRASSTDSDFDPDYRRSLFGSQSSASIALSPSSLTFNDFEIATPSDSFGSPTVPSSYPSWMNRPTSFDFGAQAIAANAQYMMGGGQSATYFDMGMLSQSVLDSSFANIKPHVLSGPNPDVMMGMCDPMIYSGYDTEVPL